MHHTTKGIALAGSLLLCSCAATLTPIPISSSPPAKAVVANSEFSVGDGVIIKKFIYPAGTYRPIYEDSKAHYFAPPGEQIRVKDTGMELGSQGGIYWEKGLPAPSKVYFTGNFGMKLPWDKKDMPIKIIR
jgi:hypothetical protein